MKKAKALACNEEALKKYVLEKCTVRFCKDLVKRFKKPAAHDADWVHETLLP